jgi:LEA14-like dessication related protein
MRRSLTLGTLLTCLCIVSAAASLLLSGCAAVQSVLNIENPSYAIRDIRPRIDIAIPLSASSIDVDFAIEVDNPNTVGLRLDEIDFDLFINNTRVLDSISQQRINIPARGRGDIQLRTRIGYENLRALWGEVLDAVRGERARYEIRGTASYDTPLGTLRFPVSVYSSR